MYGLKPLTRNTKFDGATKPGCVANRDEFPSLVMISYDSFNAVKYTGKNHDDNTNGVSFLPTVPMRNNISNRC